VPGADLRHARVADYNGDGFSDILWEDDTGNLKAWFMQGTTVAKTQTFDNTGLSELSNLSTINKRNRVAPARRKHRAGALMDGT
jgi:hypothetical protein